MSSPYTIHQRLSQDGYPYVIGSEVRMPDGTPLPGVLSVSTEAVPGAKTGPLWVTTITIHAVFGEALRDEVGGGSVHIEPERD